MSQKERELPANLLVIRRTPVFDDKTMPEGLRHRHSTKAGVWGLIKILEGRLRYRILDPRSESILDSDHPGVVHPVQLHEVEPLGPVRFFVEFYRDAAPAPMPPVRRDEFAGYMRNE